MTTPYQRLLAQAEKVLDGHYAQECRLIPQVQDQYAGAAADSSRSPAVFWAVLDWRAEAAGIGMRPELTTTRPRLHVRKAELPPGRVREGDRIELTASGQAFIVRAIHRDDVQERYTLELVEAPA